MPDHEWNKRFSAYGAMAVTASIFFLLFVGMMIAAWWRDQQLFNGAMETVKALVMVAAGYWLGSSKSGQQKDDALADASKALATSSPLPPVVTTTTTEPSAPGAPSTTTTTATGAATL